MKQQMIETPVWNWSRYRFRLFKKFMDNAHTHKRNVCFTHQCMHSLCHCKDGDVMEVSVKVAIPKKGKDKEWLKLKEFILLGEGTEINIVMKKIGINNITKKDRLKLRLLGVTPKPKASFFVKKLNQTPIHE